MAKADKAEKPIAVILAAGKGKRMNSKHPKVLHSLCGRSLIQHVLSQVVDHVSRVIVVVGYGAEQVRESVGDGVEYVYQEHQWGTGHALLQALPLIPYEGDVLVLCGDTPMLKKEMLGRMLEYMNDHSAALLTTEPPSPEGYGRIVRDEEGRVRRIVEDKDALAGEKNMREINAGSYCFKAGILHGLLPQLSDRNVQGEYYLTDLVELMVEKNAPVAAEKVGDYSLVLGINNRCQLAEAATFMRQEINVALMEGGVTLWDPGSVYIDVDVEIGRDSVLYPGTVIEGRSVIGEDCIIGPGAYLSDVYLGQGVTVRCSTVEKSSIEDHAAVGPFANIRPQSRIGKGAKIGDYVEVKNSLIGEKSKIPHHSYVGDAVIGKEVNMGAGTIIVNYDGREKSQTSVEDGAFVGCNSNLVAPLRIGEKAYIAAGSTITNDVPSGALSLGRAKQVNKEGLAKRFLQKKQD